MNLKLSIVHMQKPLVLYFFYGFHETKSYDLIIIFNFPLLST